MAILSSSFKPFKNSCNVGTCLEQLSIDKVFERWLISTGWLFCGVIDGERSLKKIILNLK